ncbi:hypothetical protein D1641_09540 [Colidextribacter sp. OB.20]|uniref:hypothetical protein n=1 Tax=Colidextribacter sp. OB.20 TaxID=2304568 RepID=UPI00136AD158|nr:hypothetical protein [Colidextribacter sp. OB.20]NBI10250.1 hypothetical protein [Colidextribacter sp. OB.20]
MKLIPFYRVSYHGDFHEAGKPFQIDPEDREEMSRHGTILAISKTVVDKPQEPVEAPAELKPKRGRPRRTENG